MPDVENRTHLHEDHGLWIPPQFREFDTQLVIRTPRTTIQHYSDGLDAYYAMITAADFGDPSEIRDPKNPDLAPDHVRFKPQGEDAVELAVDLPERTEVDA
ncbi:hypothetical protein [Halobacterium sp. CBA1126]|uniref:hypothetical protein n=1 Tax=Halobacterium sp. CBA1126 TaxID=2668074 RepID=UPI0012F93D77|nr:hypothetical protein [Halobacterium sp. CBA1126]MUV59951.1 hypothetical protein [Halobacterium sp. CBA1126]